MPIEPGVLDANVLVYAVNADAPQHSASRALLKQARDPSTALYVTSQILCELYSVIATPGRVAPAVSSADGVSIASAVLALPGLRVLPMPVDTVARWMEMLARFPVTGGGVFDLQLAATMQANRIQRIYTFNGSDFERFPSITVRIP